MRRTGWIVVAAAIVAIFTGCRRIPTTQWTWAPPVQPERVSEGEGRPYTVLDQRTRIDLVGGVTVIRTYRAIQIHNREGVKQGMGRVFVPRNGRLSSFRAATILPDGQKLELGAGDLEKVQVVRPAGARSKPYMAQVYVYPAVAPGVVLEMDYQLAVWGWSSIYDQCVLDPDVVVKRAICELSRPENLEVQFRREGFGVPDIVPGRRGYMVSRFTMTHEGTEDESYLAPSGKRSPRVEMLIRKVRGPWGQVQDVVKGWTDVAEEHYRDLSERLVVGRDVPTLAKDADAAETVWWWLHERLRKRRALGIAEPGALSVEKMIQLGYANPDDFGLALYALLENAGEKPSLLYVPTAGMPDPRDDFPSPAFQGGDVLVALPLKKDEWRVLDPYCRRCAPGEVSPVHEGRVAIEMRPQSDGNLYVGLMTIQSTGGLSSRETSSMALRLEDGRLHVESATLALSGPRASWLHGRLSSGPQNTQARTDRLRDDLMPRSQGGELSARWSENGPSKVELAVKDAVFSPSLPIQWSGGWTVSLWDLFPELWMEALADDRKTPAYISSPPGFRRTIRIRCGAGCDAVSIPKSATLGGEGIGQYRFRTARRTGWIELSEEFTLEPREVPLKTFESLSTFLNMVRKLRLQRVIFQTAASPMPSGPRL